MRLFVGISLADAVHGELAAVVARLRPRAGNLRWTAPESWHITLQFLGEVRPDKYECVAARLGEVRGAPVPVRLEALGTFDRAGIVHAGVEVTEELALLQQRVMASTAQCGFAPDTRPFHPHITLARSKGRQRGFRVDTFGSLLEGAPAFTPFVALEFLLYESFLGASGSRYEVRARFKLNGPAEH